MKKQTAVEFLIEQLDNNLDINHSWRTRQYIEQAKEMEKQQIIDAHVAGHNAPSSTIKNWDAEQYYNETFKKK
jgi:hypothetical protein